MNNEIKEILEKPNVYSFNDECYLYFGDYNKLKDYITNLQQENERSKEQVKREVEVRDYEVSLKEDYKSRIEKAINKVQYIIDIGFDYDGYNDVDNLKILVDELVDLARQTKNILNGRSDE